MIRIAPTEGHRFKMTQVVLHSGTILSQPDADAFRTGSRHTFQDLPRYELVGFEELLQRLLIVLMLGSVLGRMLRTRAIDLLLPHRAGATDPWKGECYYYQCQQVAARPAPEGRQSPTEQRQPGRSPISRHVQFLLVGGNKDIHHAGRLIIHAKLT